jgi:uncharacterized protein (DUF2164 family)|tara:strand:- start:53 stop:298 length:246 start_codon:yes stop_codon:yes gene_type:complete
MINISRKNKDKIVQDLQEWFQDNLDQDIGALDAEFLTDFFTENIGGLYYNQALKDVHTLIYEKTESLADNIYELSKDTAFE